MRIEVDDYRVTLDASGQAVKIERYYSPRNQSPHWKALKPKASPALWRRLELEARARAARLA